MEIRPDPQALVHKLEHDGRGLDDVVSILPGFEPPSLRLTATHESTLSDVVVDQLREFIQTISVMYNLEHASHVANL